ncbi:MAG TPA: HAMP domain-containing sensor histidine kinase [Caulobacteraceae bacterium]|nr:HAMP domain-containing sensor histidine kinase [Caulobacteraceae bacterium]
MRISELWRTTTFRLTILYGLIFAIGTVALLGMVYLRSAVYLTRRVDGILAVQAEALVETPPARLGQRINEALALNGRQTTILALFSAQGRRIEGNLYALPAALHVDRPPMEIPPTPSFHTHARLIARRLASGDELVVGRDVNQLQEIRAIISSTLIWSGVLIIFVGVTCGVALSIGPFRRLQKLQAAGRDIAGGDLKRRMPVGGGHDELDMFATTVNAMMDDIERLMSEVKGSTETIAHDLRTPLTRARVQLHRIQQASVPQPAEVGRVIVEIDEVLERFRAILRISELEARERRAGFSPTDLSAVIAQAVDLYQPLAEDGGVKLTVGPIRAAIVDADSKLLFEAVSNLLDNAIKFAGDGGRVNIALGGDPIRPRIIIEDNGPGIPQVERNAVFQRFYRGERDRLAPGSGLGLSIVSAIVRLHGFTLSLHDAQPGLRVVIEGKAPN